MKSITDEIELQSKRRIQVLKELESNDSVSVPHDTVKKTLINFNKLLEIADIQDKTTLLQLIISKITIKNKKDIDSIELHFDEKVQKYFINNNE